MLKNLSLNMIVVSEVVSGNVSVKKDTQFNHLEADNVTIHAYVTARIYGTVKGNLTISKGAVVFLHGKVLGKVINNGGSLNIYDYQNS